MGDKLIPDDVRQFIVDNIDSVAQLEGLLLVSRNPETDWGIDALSERLYTNRQQTEGVLSHLHSLGFLAVKKNDPTIYQYQPVTEKLAAMVDRIADAYSKYLIPVTNLIHSKPQSKVQQFADAFKFRKEDK